MRGHSNKAHASRTSEDKARDDDLREIYACHAHLGAPNCYERTLWYLALEACDDLDDVHPSEDTAPCDEWASWH